MKILHTFLIIPIFFTLSLKSFSQPVKSERSGGLFYSLSANFENSFDSDLDNGGGFGFYRFGVNGSIGKSVTERTSVELGMDYNHDSFDFTGTSGFGGLDPWEDINRAGIGLSIKHRVNNKWTLLLSPKVTFSGESGSETGDGLTYRGIAGFTYSVNKDLIVGTGIIATTRIEDNFIAFPGAVLNWRINERTVLSSIITDVRTELGPRISLKYFLTRKLSGSVSTGYEFRRFRLDDDGVAPEGIGDIKLMPLWLTVGYRMSDTLKAEFYTGTTFFGEMELEDRNGDRIQKTDFDPLLFIGAGFRIEL